MRDIFAAYIAAEHDILQFFAASPAALLTKPPAAAAWNAQLAAEIGDYQEAIGNRVCLQGNEAAIVTGQQAGLLTGPLYTIYKAATAVRLAQEIEAKFDVPCVPVFWVHGDDHDFEEAASATIVTKRHELVTCRYTPEADVSGLPMSRVPLEPSLHDIIDQVAHVTNGSEQRDAIAVFLHESLHRASSFADWMARIMARLFQGTPLIFFDPALPAARRIAATVLARELEEPTQTARLAQAQADRLEALGFPAQVAKRPEECSFFFLSNGKRRKVEYRDGQFLLPEEGRTITHGDMQNLLRQRPDCFSPNVLLRGVVQQRLFPTAAYVAGPGEVSYWAQLQPIFERHETKMPIVYPRARATLTTKKLRKLAKELNVTLSDLLGNPDELANRTLRYVANGPEMTYIREHRKQLECSVETFSKELAAMSHVGGSMAYGLARAMTEKLDHIEHVVARREGEQRDATTKKLQRLQDNLAPMRKPQERVVSIFSFLFSHGWELIPRLIQEIDVHSFAMQEIEL